MPLIQSHYVQIILRSLEASTSSGYDNISAKFLINCAEVLYEPITNLFNLSIVNEEYPDVLKRDNVVPIYKRKEVVKTLLKTTELYLFSLYWQKSLKVLSTVLSEIISIN